MNRQDILNVLNKYPFPKDEFIVLSGAALVLFGIESETHDIDIAVTERLYKQMLADYSCDFDKINPFGNKVYFLDKVINFGIDYIDVDFLLANGYRVQTPDSVKRLKLALNRPKDQKDAKAIEEWEKKHG